MIAAAVCIGDMATYERWAAPGLARALGPGAPVAEIETDSIFDGYNEALEHFSGVEDLEALVLLHEDLEIRDQRFAEKIRARLADGSIAVIGAIGASGVRSLCWWEGTMHGRVDETRGRIGSRGEFADVDSVDGLLMVLSPWAVRNLRFDSEHFSGFHGYDVDICLQALAAGKRVVVDDLNVFHHARGGVGADEDDFWRTDAALRAKWRALGRDMATDEQMGMHRRGFVVVDRDSQSSAASAPAAHGSSAGPTGDFSFSIIIVAWGKRAVTERCLESLRHTLGDAIGTTVQLVLVDNASPDDTAELFNRWRDRATIVALPENRNFSGGCNAGAAAATGEVLVFLNNDTIVEPGALEALADEVRAPGVGAAGLRLLYPDGSIQHAGVAHCIASQQVITPHHLFHRQSGGLLATHSVFEANAVTAACMAVKRSVFEQLGGYDEHYANGFEDADLCLRIRAADHAIVYRGDLWLWHDEGQTRGQSHGVLDANLRYYLARWGQELRPDDELVASVFGATLAPHPGTSSGPRGRVGVIGQVTGVSSDGAEARGMLAALEAAKVSPATGDLVTEFVRARLSANEQNNLLTAKARELDLTAPLLLVADEAADISPSALRSTSLLIIRTARRPDHEISGLMRLWVATSALREELIASGFAARQVIHVPPCVPSGPAGPGGQGILAVLPADDVQAAARIVDELSRLADDHPIRVLPTVTSRPLIELVTRALPQAEILVPTPSDDLFRELAATADIVISADQDRFQRRALTAAGVGALPVVMRVGPATEILGTDLHALHNPGQNSLRQLLEAADVRAQTRAHRAARVHQVCSIDVQAPNLQALLRPVISAADA